MQQNFKTLINLNIYKFVFKTAKIIYLKYQVKQNVITSKTSIKKKNMYCNKCLLRIALEFEQ